MVRKYTIRDKDTEITWSGSYNPIMSEADSVTVNGDPVERFGYAIISVLEGDLTHEGREVGLDPGTYVLLGQHGFYMLTPVS